MVKQIIFSGTLLITLLVFAYTIRRLGLLFRLTRKTKPFGQWRKRMILTLEVAFGQTKILRKPLIGFLHALVFWGFLVITLGSIEMVVDGISGSERIFSKTGLLYSIVSASGDVFAYVIFLGITIFLIRRKWMHIKRFSGIELSPRNKKDAYLALLMILFLMVSLIGINFCFISASPESIAGVYPVSAQLAGIWKISSAQAHLFYEMSWWSHILLIFIFANYLPYSKHFHVFMSVPNVLLSNLEPLAKLPNLDALTREVRLMLDGNAFQNSGSETPARFGVKDVEDITWKNYLDSLTCTQCGRCTEVCPANITGKKLSPRKIFVDLRKRMNEKGTQLIKNKAFDDNKSLVSNDFISYEELWACTTCNACAQECPLNISHPNLIMDMRRYLVLEEGKAPSGINAMFANIENNGAPWQFSPQDRLEWTKG
jgi:heterodisulfide reductase subunit C/nitrate reductase gamma subunit